MDNRPDYTDMGNELDIIDEYLSSIEAAIVSGTGSMDETAAAQSGAVNSSTEFKNAGAVESAHDVKYDRKSELPSKSSASNREVLMKLDEIKKKLEMLDEIDSKLELIDEMDEQLNYIKNFLDTKLNIDFEAMYNNMLEQMNIEAIKIYRNIQAVIVEEDAKQNHVLFGVDGKSDKLKFRMNHVIIFSIISFVVSILVMVLQILPAFGIELF